jgi:hypothetical protein
MFEVAGRPSTGKTRRDIMEYDLHSWPELDWPEWKDTAETLHMYMQIVGKTRLALTPLQNHWWNVSSIPHRTRSLDLGDALRRQGIHSI